MRSLLATAVIVTLLRKEHLTFSLPQILSCLGYAGNAILIVAATKYTTAANAIILQYSAPIFVALMSFWILGERARKWDWLMIFICLAGLCLFFLDELQPGHLLGNFLGILSGIFFAVYILFMRKQKDAYPLGSVFLGNILVALVVLPFLVTSGPQNNIDWLYLLLLGFFQLGLAHVLYASAIKNITAIESSIVPFIEPIMNPVWVFLLISERPGHWAIIGGLIILTSVFSYSVRSAISKNRHLADISAAG